MRVVFRTVGDVRIKHSPSPSLWQACHEMDWHGESAGELTEDHLLASFSRDRQRQMSGGGARVEMREEAVDTGLSPPSESIRGIKLSVGLVTMRS